MSKPTNNIYVEQEHNFIPSVGPKLHLHCYEGLGTLRFFQAQGRQMMEDHLSTVSDQHSLSAPKTQSIEATLIPNISI